MPVSVLVCAILVKPLSTSNYLLCERYTGVIILILMSVLSVCFNPIIYVNIWHCGCPRTEAQAYHSVTYCILPTSYVSTTKWYLPWVLAIYLYKDQVTRCCSC